MTNPRARMQLSSVSPRERLRLPTDIPNACAITRFARPKAGTGIRICTLDSRGGEPAGTGGRSIGYDRPCSPGLGVLRWAVARDDDYYRILQVDPAAHDDVIQAAYRRLALRYHPDRNPSAAAARVMARINAAYEVLSDPARRAEYDRGRRLRPRDPPRPAPTESKARTWFSRRAAWDFLKRLIRKRRSLIALFLVILLIWLRPELLLATIGLAIAAAAFHFRLAARYLVVALALVASFLALTAPNLGNPVYSAGLFALNAVTDPATRGFWPDPAHMELGATVVIDTGGQLRAVETASEAGRAEAVAAIESDRGTRIVQSISEFLVMVALLIAGIDLAARLAGIKRASDPDPTKDRVLRLGRPMRLGLFALVAGLAAVIIGAAPQQILDGMLESGVRYTRGGGINSEAEFLLWPMLILDKVEGLGYIAITLGTFGIGLGAPRRRITEWIDRRARLPGAWRYDAVLKKAGSGLLVAAFCVYWFDVFVVDQFLVPTAREIVKISSGDSTFLDSPANYPEWLQVTLAPLEIWPLIAVSGIVLLAAGSRSLRKLLSRSTRGLHWGRGTHRHEGG